MPAKPVVTATWIEFDDEWYYQLWIGDRSWTHDGGPRDKWEPASPSARHIDPTEMTERIEFAGGPRQTVEPKRGRGRPALDDGLAVNLNFRVSAELAEFVHADAARLGQTYAEWLRRLIAARRQQVEDGRKAAK